LKLLKLFAFSAFLFSQIVYAQNYEDDFEFFVVDSYVSMEKPYIFHLMFFTSDSSVTKILLNDKYNYDVSSFLSDEHRIDINLSSLAFDSVSIPYKIFAYDSDGKLHESEISEIELPEKIVIPEGSQSNIFTTVCIGSVIFLMPSPGVIFDHGNNYITLAKELPLLSFYDVGFNYPTGYISAEYSFTFKSDVSDYFRIGYKRLYQPGKIEFISIGANYSTDFKGFNGVSPEISIGLFNIYDAFVLSAKYRYNIMPGNSARNFHEVSLGLYSNYFSINF